MPQSVALSPSTLLDALQWRYATKVFDSAKTISEADWKALEASLILTPTSYGLQPYRFTVVTDLELKAKLRPVSWGQSQVTDASHLVVFTAQQDMTEADIDRWIQRIVDVRGVDPSSLKGYRDLMVANLVKGPQHARIADWAARQAYIAFGQLMTGAALLGIDACPLEGLDPAAYDAILGLEGSGFKTVAACALGYRSESDKYASLPKVRYTADRLIDRR
jgi:nitroreductase